MVVPPGNQAGSEVRMEICFEPHHLGEATTLLRLSSMLGGQYVFPLRGTCLEPRPQGPFTIRPGSSISIPFKNVFLYNASISYQVRARLGEGDRLGHTGYMTVP